MSRRAVFLDTSFVIALLNKDDPHHVRAKGLDDELMNEGALLILHWGVLLEIADGFARLGRRALGLRLLSKLTGEEGYDLVPISESLIQEAIDLYRSRADKEWGLTDCISFVLMKQRGVSEAITADIHFTQAGFTALLLSSP